VSSQEIKTAREKKKACLLYFKRIDRASLKKRRKDYLLAGFVAGAGA